MLKFPEDKIEWALFRGIEQEGPCQGKETLFVVGDVPFEKICAELYKKEVNVYFGAGGRFDFNPETVYLIACNEAGIYPAATIIIESPTFDGMLFKKISYNHDDCFWVIPYIWNGIAHPVGLRHLSMLINMAYRTKHKVLAKADFQGNVVIHEITSTYMNSYIKGYSEDALIIQKGKTCE